MLHNRLVLGARDKAVRVRLFREKEYNLAKTIQSLRISEAMQLQHLSIGGKEEETVKTSNICQSEISFVRRDMPEFRIYSDQ